MAAFGFMGMLVIFMVLIGITKTRSLADANSEIAGGLYAKASESAVLSFLCARYESSGAHCGTPAGSGKNRKSG